jgi:hypothetical protein
VYFSNTAFFPVYFPATQLSFPVNLRYSFHPNSLIDDRFLPIVLSVAILSPLCTLTYTIFFQFYFQLHSFLPILLSATRLFSFVLLHDRTDFFST